MISRQLKTLIWVGGSIFAVNTILEWFDPVEIERNSLLICLLLLAIPTITILLKLRRLKKYVQAEAKSSRVIFLAGWYRFLGILSLIGMPLVVFGVSNGKASITTFDAYLLLSIGFVAYILNQVLIETIISLMDRDKLIHHGLQL